MNSTRTGIGAYLRRRSPNGSPSPEAQERTDRALAAQRPGLLLTKQQQAARAAGYSALPIGTEFVIIGGAAIETRFVCGRRSGDMIVTLPAGAMHEVYTREETLEEKAARHAQEQQSVRRVVSQFDPGCDPIDLNTAIWEMA